MRRPVSSVLPLAVSALALGFFASAPAAAQDSVLVRDDVGWLRIENGLSFRVHADLVSLRPAEGVSLTAVIGEAGLSGAEVVRSNRLGIVDLRLPEGVDPIAAVEALRATGRVDFAEDVTTGHYTGIPNDPQFGQQWSKHNTGQSGGTPDADIDAPAAWDLEDGDSSVVVAVLDSGTEWFHEDLADAIWDNADETLDGTDSDGNGYVDDVRGWDFDDGDNNPAGAFFHGTAVASVVGAVAGNGLGIAGVAGGASDGEGCRVMPLNVGSFSPDAAVLDDAILYAVDNGARVVTMSLSVGTSTPVADAIAYAVSQDVFVDNAAGNNGSFGVSFPSTLPDCVAVASSTRFDTIAGSSSKGPEVEVTAPGDDILMCDVGGGYLVSSGTSFASPHVAGLAALLFSANPGLSAADVKTIILSTADDLGEAATAQGVGRINAEAALLLGGSGVLGQALPYGAPLAGSGGVEPFITTFGGVPNLGDVDFGVQLANALGSTTAWFVLGFDDAAVPFKLGTLLVDVGGPGLAVAVGTSPTGRAQVPVPVPNDPVAEGLSFFTQWIVVDGGAPAGFSLSGALELVVGS